MVENFRKISYLYYMRFPATHLMLMPYVHYDGSIPGLDRELQDSDYIKLRYDEENIITNEQYRWLKIHPAKPLYRIPWRLEN